jgi:hypothetical protein
MWFSTSIKAPSNVLRSGGWGLLRPWSEALESLEFYHGCGFYSCVSLILERALTRGYLPLVQRFVENRGVNEKREYVVVAAERSNVVFLRWMLANGTPIDTASAIQLAAEITSGEYIVLVQPLHNFQVPSLRCIIHRVCCTAFRSVPVQPPHDIEMPTLRCCTHCIRRESVESVSVQPLHHLKVAIRGHTIHRMRVKSTSAAFVQPLQHW